jgi:hypothetical protein
MLCGACCTLPRCWAAAGVPESAARITNKAGNDTFFIERLQHQFGLGSLSGSGQSADLPKVKSPLRAGD